MKAAGGANLARGYRRHGITVAFVLLFPLLFAVTTAWQYGLPVPRVHDEHAQLLMARTFALGRLTNPSHPMGVFFESFHVIQWPSYMGKFPPGPALSMALGQVVAGHPIAGVWLVMSLAAVALWWFLRGYVSDGWAVCGAVIFATHPLARQWAMSYWGGGMAVLGASLFLGAMVRGLRRPRGRWGFWMGIGLSLLAFSRPAEGLLTAMLAAPAGWLLLRNPRYAWGVAMGRMFGVAAAVLALCGAWMLYYNHRVTGDALLMPQALHARQYMVVPYFAWQSPRPAPAYHHAVLEAFHAGTEVVAAIPASPVGPLVRGHLRALARVGRDLELYGPAPRFAQQLDVSFTGIVNDYRWGYLLAIPCATCVLAGWRSPKARWAVLVLAIWPMAQAVETYCMTRYFAPVFPVIVAAVVLGLRWVGWQLRPLGRVAATVLVGIVVAWHLWSLGVEGITGSRSRQVSQMLMIQEQLRPTAGNHLVFVSYPAGSDGQGDWVYNLPDVDAGKIVWARDMGGEKNAALIAYYPQRTAWVFEEASGRLRPGGESPGGR